MELASPTKVRFIQYTEISGEIFNTINENKRCYKIVTNQHRSPYMANYTWAVGMNHLRKGETFVPFCDCGRGGLYFVNNLDDLAGWVHSGCMVAVILVPDDARVWIEASKFKADKLYVSKIVDIRLFFDELSQVDLDLVPQFRYICIHQGIADIWINEYLQTLQSSNHTNEELVIKIRTVVLPHLHTLNHIQCRKLKSLLISRQIPLTTFDEICKSRRLDEFAILAKGTCWSEIIKEILEDPQLDKFTFSELISSIILCKSANAIIQVIKMVDDNMPNAKLVGEHLLEISDQNKAALRELIERETFAPTTNRKQEILNKYLL